MKKKIKSILLNTIKLTCLVGAFVYIFQPELTIAKNLNYINATIYLLTSILLLFCIFSFSLAIPIFVADGASERNVKELERIIDLKQHINSKLNTTYYILGIAYIITSVVCSSIFGISPIFILLHTIFVSILKFNIIPWAESAKNKMQSELDTHNEALKQNPWYEELKNIRGED